MKKRKGYIHRIAAAITKGAVATGEVASLQTQHDDYCRMMHGGPECNCYPILLLSRSTGLFQIDHKGRLIPAVDQWRTDSAMSSFAPHRAAN